jgi:hypothetical protein
MTHKKTLFVLTLILVASLILAGCGTTATAEPAATEEPAAQTAPEAASTEPAESPTEASAEAPTEAPTESAAVAPAGTVSFANDVMPIIQSRCTNATAKTARRRAGHAHLRGVSWPALKTARSSCRETQPTAAGGVDRQPEDAQTRPQVDPATSANHHRLGSGRRAEQLNNRSNDQVETSRRFWNLRDVFFQKPLCRGM